MYSLDDIILMFFCYAVIGWAWETIYCSLKAKHFVYRGFLFGPYCPVYGFAVTTVVVCTAKVTDNLVLLFLGGMVVSTVFEYLAAVFLENIFHLKLWDYSMLKGNIKGRIAPEISLFWGFAVVVITRLVQVYVLLFVKALEQRFGHGAATLVVLILATDTTFTVLNMQKFRAHALLLESRITDERARLKQEFETAWSKRPYLKLGPESQLKQLELYLDSWHETILRKLNESEKKFTWNERRMLKSFPKLRFIEAPDFEEIKERLLKK